MLSRVADSFYWMSRYLERAEHAARVIDVHLSLTLDDPTNMVGRSLLEAIGAAPPEPVAGSTEAPGATGRIDPAHREAVTKSVFASRENARQIREQISSEMWEQLNRMYLSIRESQHNDQAEPAAVMRSVVEGALLFQGVTESTLSHGEAWQYMQLGRYIERATSTAALLEAYFADSEDSEGNVLQTRPYVDWVGLLRACAAFEPYCRFYTADLRPERIAEFLLLNLEFPRSVRFASERIEDALRAIARSLGRPATQRPDRFAGRLRSALDFTQIDEIIADDLVQYVQNIGKQCEQVHGAMYQTYIAYPIETAIAK